MGLEPLQVLQDYEDMSIQKPTTVRAIGKGDLALSASGHLKINADTNLFSSGFAFNVNRDHWVPYEDRLEVYEDINLTRITTINGKLSLKSGTINGEEGHLFSRRHPNYQSNRGYILSTVASFPNKNAIGIRKVGLLNLANGAFFELTDGVLYGVVRTTIDTIVQETFRQAINLADPLLENIDLENLNILEIQIQWRGAGFIRWFLVDQETGASLLVLEYNGINVSSDLAISNSALPIGYGCTNTDGTEVEIQAGAVEVLSEGGSEENRTYGAHASSEVSTSTSEVPIVALHIPTQVLGQSNTRNIVLAQMVSYADANSLVKMYYFRDPTAITATFTDLGYGFQSFSDGTDITSFDLAKMQKLFEGRVSAGTGSDFINPDKGNADMYLVSGDYILVTMTAKNNSLGGVTLGWGTEI